MYTRRRTYAVVAIENEDGVQYKLLECDNLEIFSEMGVWLGVVEQYGEEIIEEKDGYFEGTYKNEGFRKPADYYDEGETDFYFVSTDSEHMTARWIHKENGELTLREYNFNLQQIEELYDYYH